jgi:hypothetical protein
MWDFRNVRWETRDVMRYDTPGDWHSDFIEVWSGLPYLNRMAILLHEFNESAILRAAGITEEMIDIMDNFKNAAFQFARGEICEEELGDRARLYYVLPPEITNLYDEAHVLALQVERAFLEAAGGNWKEHCKLIEDSRGKIPVVQP